MTAHCVSVVMAARKPILCSATEFLQGEDDFNVVATCQDGASCVEVIRDLSPDVALLDVSLPSQSALQVLRTIASERLCTRVVFLSSDGSDAEKPTALRARAVIPRKPRRARCSNF